MYQGCYEGDDKSIVRRGRAGLWGHSSFSLSQAVVCDCTERLLFQERLFWPKPMVSLLPHAQVWYNTSLEPGCTAGGTGEPGQVLMLMHQLCGRRQALPAHILGNIL